MSQEPEAASKQKRNRPPLHRRQYIVDGPVQLRLVATLLCLWLANSVFFTLVLYFFYEGHVLRFYELIPRAGQDPLVPLPTLFVLAIGFVVTFGIIIVGLMGLYLSNQVAGPLYRMKLYLQRMGKGDWNFEVRFREGDFIGNIPDVFNGMLDGLRDHARSEVEQLRAIEEMVADNDKARTLVSALRERKEVQLGVAAHAEPGTGQEQKQLSLAVH